MLTIVGDDELDIIEFENGMKIQIDFGIDKTGSFGWRGRITGKYRRVQLFDKQGLLLSEVIEENPLYEPEVKMAIPEGDKVIY